MEGQDRTDLEELQSSLAQLEAQSSKIDGFISQLDSDLHAQQVLPPLPSLSLFLSLSLSLSLSLPVSRSLSLSPNISCSPSLSLDKPRRDLRFRPVAPLEMHINSCAELSAIIKHQKQERKSVFEGSQLSGEAGLASVDVPAPCRAPRNAPSTQWPVGFAEK